MAYLVVLSAAAGGGTAPVPDEMFDKWKALPKHYSEHEATRLATPEECAEWAAKNADFPIDLLKNAAKAKK